MGTMGIDAAGIVQRTAETSGLPPPELRCRRCGYRWTPRGNRNRLPVSCPNPACRSPYWNEPPLERTICGECGHEFSSLGGRACPRCRTPIGREVKVPELATCPLCGEFAPWDEVMRRFRCERFGRSLEGVRVEARWGIWGWRRATLRGVSGVRFAIEYDDAPGQLQYRPASAVRRAKERRGTTVLAQRTDTQQIRPMKRLSLRRKSPGWSADEP